MGEGVVYVEEESIGEFGCEFVAKVSNIDL
jgi:hypothetical protein